MNEEQDSAVKVFDRNNDALPLEQRIEEVAPQPKPKVPLKARTYHALSKLPSYLGGKFFSEKYRDVSSVDFLESLLRVEELISEAISQWQNDNQTNGFEDCKHPVGELKNRLAEAKKIYCVESNEENVARLEIERLNGMIHYFKKMAENYAEMECVDLARYSETSFYSYIAKSIEKRLNQLTKPRKRHNPEIKMEDLEEFRNQGFSSLKTPFETKKIKRMC